jgi:antitoxin (DNA-binding transcriptional repressor) of toxin-antitoxin stability system
MAKTIFQREVPNTSGEIMRTLARGEEFLVTRHGIPVGELRPVHHCRFVPAATVVAAFAGAPPIDSARFRREVDAALDQEPTPRA